MQTLSPFETRQSDQLNEPPPTVADGLLALAEAVNRLGNILLAIHDVDDDHGEECVCPECMAARETGEQ